MGADKEDTKGPSTATAAAAGSLSASFSLDPYDLLKLAGSRISATENPIPRWAVAEEAGPWKVRLIERTVHPLPSAPYRDTCPPSRYDNNPRQLHRLLHQPSFPGYLLLGDGPAWHLVLHFCMWPKFLTLPTSRGHKDLARKMIIGNQLWLLLRLLVVSCLHHLPPIIYLELS